MRKTQGRGQGWSFKKQDVIHSITAAKESAKKRIIKWPITFRCSDIIVKLEKKINFSFRKFKWQNGDDIGQKLEEDIESKVGHLGWDRLKHVNGLRGRMSGERWGNEQVTNRGMFWERKKGMGVSHRNRTERPPHPRSWKKGSKVIIWALGGGNPYEKLRKITSDGFTCFCNKLGHQVVIWEWAVWGLSTGVGLKRDLTQDKSKVAREAAHPSNLSLCCCPPPPLHPGKLDWVHLAYVSSATCTVLLRAFLTWFFTLDCSTC